MRRRRVRHHEVVAEHEHALVAEAEEVGTGHVLVEGDAVDAVRAQAEPMSAEDLMSALAGHHATDLDRCADDAARAEAIDALVEGYMHGG